MRISKWLIVSLLGCSEYDFLSNSNGPQGIHEDDGECFVDLPEARSEVDPDCVNGESSAPPANPWSVTTEWHANISAMWSTPTVGDLDGDGVPSVVVMGNGPYFSAVGELLVFNGATGELEWSLGPDFDTMSGTALADVDGDGDGDIIASHGTWNTMHTVSAYDGTTGEHIWSTDGPTGGETYPAIGDLEGDGTVEVVVNEFVFDGATGEILFTLEGVTNNWGAPVIADMDLDGSQEILLANTVYSSMGSPLWSCGVGAGGAGTFPHPVNTDSDENAELLVSSGGSLTLCDDDGTVLWSRAVSSSYGAAIAVADFDDDGMQEFAIATRNMLMLIEGDNSLRWQTPIDDGTGLAGATSWDINLDGVPEVIYADEENILVFNGANGEVVIEFAEHASVTLAETPSVADVDGDGAGELIYTSNGGNDGLTVIGGADGDWPYSRPVYNQYSYSSTNINDDLSVPTDPVQPWIDDANLFRGQPSGVWFNPTSDLKAAITDACVTACVDDGDLTAAVQVSNSGADVPAGVQIDVWGESGLIESVVLESPLQSGKSYEFLVTTTFGLVGNSLRVDVSTDSVECDVQNNTDEWTDWDCEESD